MKNSIIKFEKLDTKESINGYVKVVRDLMVDGNHDPLLIAKHIKGLEMLVKEIKNDKFIKSCITDEYDLYKEKEVELYDCTFQVRESGVKYDFRDCNCAEYNCIQKDIDKLTKRKKVIEDMLKKLPAEGLADPNTGEIMYPPSKTSSDALFISFK